MPPTKPTLPVFEVIAASMPTRYEPSSSLNSTDCTLGRSTLASMMVNFTFGNSLATTPSGVACAKPMAMTIVAPRRAVLRKACSRCASLVTSKSR